MDMHKLVNSYKILESHSEKIYADMLKDKKAASVRKHLEKSKEKYLKFIKQQAKKIEMAPEALDKMMKE